MSEDKDNKYSGLHVPQGSGTGPEQRWNADGTSRAGVSRTSIGSAAAVWTVILLTSIDRNVINNYEKP